VSDNTIANQLRLHPFTDDDLYTGNPPAVYVTLAVAAAKRFPSLLNENDKLRAGLLEAIEEIETTVRLEWSRSPLGGYENDDRWQLAQRLRLLANPSTPPGPTATVKR
jgi:hypothetical protein